MTLCVYQFDLKESECISFDLKDSVCISFDLKESVCISFSEVYARSFGEMALFGSEELEEVWDRLDSGSYGDKLYAAVELLYAPINGTIVTEDFEELFDSLNAMIADVDWMYADDDLRLIGELYAICQRIEGVSEYLPLEIQLADASNPCRGTSFDVSDQLVDDCAWQ
jgi:hypothetical protein